MATDPGARVAGIDLKGTLVRQILGALQLDEATAP